MAIGRAPADNAGRWQAGRTTSTRAGASIPHSGVSSSCPAPADSSSIHQAPEPSARG